MFPAPASTVALESQPSSLADDRREARSFSETDDSISEVMRRALPPLLLDVTPLSLSIETVGGYCEVVVPRSATIPLEETRLFTTGHDFQDSVRVRICQGESRVLDENEVLGEVELVGLRSAARGEILVRVSFVLAEDGLLSVRAVDLATGREQTVSLRRIGAIEDEDIARMRARQEALLNLNASAS